jgi:uncharacterized protein (TIGR03118 family)
MNYQSFPTPSTRTFTSAVIVAALSVVALLTTGAPKSSAARATAPFAVDTCQNSPELTFVAIYEQTNMVSDLPGAALVEDPYLVNPWAVALNASSPFWIVNNGDPNLVNGSAFATLYQGDVAGSPLIRNQVVGITAPPSTQTLRPAPTAIVANTTNDFVVSLTPTSPAAPAQFIIASEIGAISAWQPFLGSQATIVKVVSGHQHTGLAIGNNGSANLLYAADFTNANIDVFDSNFNLTSVPGNFADATIPASYHPFNIQNLDGSLYVTYAQFNQFSHRPNNGPGMGFVRKFDMNGVRDNGFAINNGVLDAPWGIVIAPPASGSLSGFLLVGNFTTSAPVTQSSVNIFNATTGALFGSLTEGGAAYLRIDELRALVFGNGGNAGDSRTLYFSAGSFSEHHGLFGSLKPVTGIPPSTIQFSGMNWNNTDYFVREDEGHIDITVSRAGDTAGTATVNYATVNGGASQCCNYEIALGKLTFGPGETTKTFRVLIVDNHQFAAGTSTALNLVLSNATGAALVTPKNVQLLIFDDEGDTPGSPPNTSDDPALFVRQQYFDFLNREPDPSGFSFWLNEITSCGSDAACIERKRINVSAAFFLSIEFQRTGMTVFLTNKLAASTGGYGHFMNDVQLLQRNYVFGAPGADAQLEANKQAFFNHYTLRPEFVARFSGMSNEQYVDTLLQNRETGSSSAERDPLVAGLNNGTEARATVLRKIGEFPAFRTQEFNRAFVTMEYFGYLRRDPDAGGFNFWLNKLNSFNGDFQRAEMVKAFLRSTEYRRRFGPP